MTAGMFGYVVNDALIKWAAEDLPLFQAVFLRGLLIVALLAAIVGRLGVGVPVRSFTGGPIALRMTMEALGTVVYLLALTQLPLAELTSVLQLVPIAVTFAAARLLRERVSLVRVASVAAGFVGVLLIVKPGSDAFSPWFLAGFASVAIIVVRELATRRIPTDVAGVTVALGTAVVITVLGAVISVFQGWESPAPGRLGALAAAACFLSLGYVASINSIRSGDLSFSAPFRYTVLVFAIVLQIVIFRDVPDALTFVGAAIVSIAGLAALRSERDHSAMRVRLRNVR